MTVGRKDGVFEAEGHRLLIRPPTVVDLERFMRFNNALAEEKKTNPELAIIDPDTVLTTAQAKKQFSRIIDGLKSGDVISVGAYEAGYLVGSCEIYRPRNAELRHAGLLGIAILNGYRGMGIGEKLTKSALSRARHLGIKVVELRVFSTNAPAIRLYERVGFERVGVIPGMILKNGRYIDDLIMCIGLRGTDKSPARARGKS